MITLKYTDTFTHWMKGLKDKNAKARVTVTGRTTMTTTEQLHDFDEVDFLDTDEDIAAYLTASLETGDAAYIAHALGVVARARGMTKVAEASGVSREMLYRSLSSEGNPTLRTLLAVLPALGVRLTSVPATQAHA